MTQFYKISKENAELIGAFEYELGKFFTPFISEQTSGEYLISEKMYDLLKDTEQFKKVDFSTFEKINDSQINTKKLSLIP